MININRITFNRPANTTPYTAGDVVAGGGASGTMEIPKMASLAGSGGYIIGAQLLTDNANVTNAEFRAWLFSDSVISSGDNIGFDLQVGAGAEKSFVGYIDFILDVAGQGISPKALFVENNVNMAFRCSDQSLFVVLTALKAYTPGSSENFYLSFLVDQF